MLAKQTNEDEQTGAKPNGALGSKKSARPEKASGSNAPLNPNDPKGRGGEGPAKRRRLPEAAEGADSAGQPAARNALEGEEQRALLETILAQEDNGIIVCDARGRVTFVNAAANQSTPVQPGWDLSEGPAAWGVVRSSEGQPISLEEWPVFLALQGEKTIRKAFRILLADGGDVEIKMNSAPIYTADGRLLGAVTFVADITDQKQAEASLRRDKQVLEAREVERSAELELSNHRLQAVLEALPVGVAITDASGRILQVNHMLNLVWGGEVPLVGDVAGYAVFKAWHATTGIPLRPEEWALARALKGNTTVNEIIDIERFDGIRATIFAGGAPVFDDEGRFLGAVAIAQDITAQRRLETQAREAARDARRWAIETESIFNALTDAVVVYDPDGKVRQANPLAIAMFGFDPLHYLRDAVAHRLLHKGAEALPSSRAERREILVNERLIFTNPRGRSYSALVSAAPMIIKNELTGVVEVWHDVTEREKLVEELAFEQLRLQAIMDSAPAGILLVDARGQFLLANPAATEIIGDEIQGSLLEPNRVDALRTMDGTPIFASDLPLSVTLRSGQSIQNQELIFHRLDGTEIILLMNSAPVLDAQGRIGGAVAVMQDITDRKRAEQDLRESESRERARSAELEQFAFVASHDLQEPLRKIRFFGERLKEQFEHSISEQEIDFLNRMLNASNRMQSMINDLLTYSRVTTKANPFESVDLSQVAMEVLNDLDARIERSDGKVELGQLPVINADPMQMRQLLQNLIGNALKFHRPDVPPIVKISSKIIEGPFPLVELLIEDNGIGFDLQYLERIFQPFERLHGRSEYEGSGMGLAICRKIAERHHGEITASSVQGEGTTFIVRLPLKQAIEEGDSRN